MEYTLRTSSQLEPILKAYRKSRGLSQAELAQKTGVTQQSVQELEAAPQRASFERLLSIFNALDVEVVLRDKSPSSASSVEW